MTSPGRKATGSAETRRRLLDIAERLMLDEGYAAVGIRRVAREAGVTPPLVLYYFTTLDELYLAVLRRGADEEIRRQRRALASPNPLRALWKLGNRPRAALITEEFMALSNHRKSIRAEIAAQAERYRRAQLDSLAEAATEGRIDLRGLSPMAVVVLTTMLSRVLVMEKAMGLTVGHAETGELVEQILRRFDDPADDA
ncbi:TetR/AcrR family transcriptional regulator [Actinomadura fibrosa]|uniref:TetR/AcrR family transcriptional regulator n=1 Tax=Actinomadura fibrosa TaxID=111802 RepID=A0ABW2XTI1_9ACTN|nr:TetR/AcrR family transcriptional regulator [Actinomadura fibrosa]